MVEFFSDSERIAISDEKESLSYSELCRRIELCSNRLRNYSVESVGIEGVSTIDTVVTFFGAVSAGLKVVMINSNFRASRIREIVESYELELLVWSRPVDILCTVVTAEMLMMGSNRVMMPPEDYTGRSRIVILTSGTTTEGRGVVHSFDNFVKSATASNRNICVGQGDSWLLSLPLFHVGGLAILFRTILGGGEVVVQGDRELEEVIAQKKITHLSLVPTQLYRLLESSLCDNEVYKNLKALLLGGAPAERSLILKAIAHHIPLYRTYGMSEAASQVTTSSAPVDELSSLNSGSPLKGMEVKILESGEVAIRCNWLFEKYIGEKSSWKNSEGWFFTGDTGKIDGNGCLEIYGRVDNMFISGGENIQPEEIEKTISEFEGVVNVVVVPVNDAEYGMRPAAFIKWAEKSKPEELEVWMKENISGIKRPVKVFSWPDDYRQEGLKINRKYFKDLVTGSL